MEVSVTQVPDFQVWIMKSILKLSLRLLIDYNFDCVVCDLSICKQFLAMVGQVCVQMTKGLKMYGKHSHQECDSR